MKIDMSLILTIDVKFLSLARELEVASANLPVVTMTFVLRTYTVR